jgi:predicted O-linked N-acetylglucosamine transferase (SPINDLY family)
MTALGHPEWIAESEVDYVRIAADLVRDPQRLARLRGALRGEMARSPLCDGPGFARAMEAAFREMWRRWCADQ